VRSQVSKQVSNGDSVAHSSALPSRFRPAQCARSSGVLLSRRAPSLRDRRPPHRLPGQLTTLGAQLSFVALAKPTPLRLDAHRDARAPLTAVHSMPLAWRRPELSSTLREEGSPTTSRKSEEPPAPTGGLFSTDCHHQQPQQLRVMVVPTGSACNAPCVRAPALATRRQPSCRRPESSERPTRGRRSEIFLRGPTLLRGAAAPSVDETRVRGTGAATVVRLHRGPTSAGSASSARSSLGASTTGTSTDGR
jgi:hypothetical protein